MRKLCALAIAFSACSTGGEGELPQPREVPGPGAPEWIACTPSDHVDFGLARTGGAGITKTITCSNSGPVAVTIDAAVRGLEEFSLASASKLVVEPRGRVELAIVFRASRAGSRSAFFDVDSVAGRAHVRLTATGVEDVACTGVEIAPRVLSFGVVERGRHVVKTLEVWNRAEGPCLLESATAAGEGLSVRAGTLPAWIPAGAIASIEIGLTAGDTVSGSIELRVSGTLYDVPVVATSVGAHVVMVPEILELEAELGCSAHPRAVNIINVGTVDATIHAASFSGSFSSNDLLPEILRPGESALFAVRYSAVADGLGSLRIEYSAADDVHQVLESELVGRALPITSVTEMFDQLHRPRVDVLYVIENGPTMIEEQASLAANLASLEQFIMNQDLDAQIGYTTTSGDGVVTATAQLGTSGSTSSQGLLAIETALAGTFPRPDAFFSAIVISDVDDVSPGLVDRYVDVLRAYGPLSSVSAIVGDAGGCSGEGGTAIEGARYTDAARQTGGIFASICSADWSFGLENLGTTGFGYRSRFFLRQVPRPNTISIEVDGSPVPEVSSNGQRMWTYDHPTTSINFSPFAVPVPDAHLVVTYALGCD